jgi:hypothetical protein
MLIKNLIIQVTTLTIAIIASYIISKLAAEELQQYNNTITKITKVLYVITLIIPIVFIEKIMTATFIAISYGVIAFPKKNETQLFYMLSPITLFLATQNSTAQLLTLCCFFAATMFTTTIILTNYVKKDQLIWKRKILNDFYINYRTFVSITILLYGIMQVLQL